jgi:hypothetical protein
VNPPRYYKENSHLLPLLPLLPKAFPAELHFLPYPYREEVKEVNHLTDKSMSSYHHRTSGGISDELTEAQKLEISQRLLAREVSNACQAWLDARGIVSKGPRRHYPTRAAGDGTGAQETGTGDDGQAELLEKTENRGAYYLTEKHHPRGQGRKSAPNRLNTATHPLSLRVPNSQKARA